MYRFVVKLLLLSFFLVPSLAIGQTGFRGTFVFGMNAAQLDGDLLYGFDKWGLSTGARIGYSNNSIWDVNIEMLYSQRGSAVSPFTSVPGERISLDYLELPIIFSIRDWYIEGKNYYKVRAEAGFSYGFLFNTDTPGFEPSYFSKHDVSWLAGLTYQFSRRFGVHLRYTSGIRRIYNDPTAAERQLQSYFITLRNEFYF